MFATDNANRMDGLKDELALAAGKVTPGVDDTPYIQYAIQALTRDQSGDSMAAFPSGTSAAPSDNYQRSRRLHDEEMGARTPLMPQAAYLDDRDDDFRSHGPEPVRNLAARLPKATPAPAPAPEPTRVHSALNLPAADAGHWVPVAADMRKELDASERTYPPLTYKPRILRPFSMIILMVLCILMIIGLAFSAVYSNNNSGLTSYPGTIYSGKYFVFRLMPALLAAIVLIYAQNIVAASMRVLPFTAMASEDPRQRYLALFQKLHPTTYLVPRLTGPWQFQLFSVATTLTCFTIPLHSAAFTVLYVDGVWAWAAVQGVVWTLVVLYAILAVATGSLMVFWFRQWTGLLWDIRSIGDLIPLLNRSNGMSSYDGLDVQRGGHAFRVQLRERWFDRLGYWRTGDLHTGGMWYTIGSSSPHSAHDPQTVMDIVGKRASYDPSLDSRDMITPGNVHDDRYRYLPWCLRDGAVSAFLVTSAALLLALLVVSFLPSTRLDKGWRPLLSARPDGGAFSPANFLYSFLPSLLGMVLFLLFQSLDMSLRILQPWAALGKLNGSPARKALLADYAACLPFQCAIRAIRNGHWKVAVMSLMAVLFIAIPALGGGLFMALTDDAGSVRMFPSMPVFGVLLALLFCYLGSASLMLTRRAQYMLPHPVACLADIISFCAAEELRTDEAFRSVRSRADLHDRLGATGTRDPREESTWFFGIVPGRDEQRLSVRREKRFTRMAMRTTRSMV